MHLRSVELQMPDRATAVEFLKNPWGMTEVGTRGNTTFLRGTAAQHYAVSITEGPARAILSATIAGTREEVEAVYERVNQAGLRHGPWIHAFDEPGGGAGFYAAGLEGEPFRFVAEAEPPPEPLPTERANPIRVAHVVFNTRDRAAATRMFTDVFGFKVSDSTRFMTFLRCDDLHHVIAYADSKQPTLNHIAFEMKDTDAVLRGMGRLKDAGCGTVWGPGRHGPGDNVFAYFVGPFGACIEYTAEIMRVDDDYVTGTPDTWKFPDGRNDQWGIFTRDMEALSASCDTFPYGPTAA
ncbi:VOC family protein [Caballeronia sp. LP006]|uniref:VOC family protein n=1 Tax=Caballeronia sp. LP006 TaxID=3038552 RepID=UPI002863C252|nr:VOC family protein [Caballeronia sp. LP006]MDR5832534.1 VOC family protein [Caballeronia sp. LP006]